jgi:hypothetical protein
MHAQVEKELHIAHAWWFEEYAYMVFEILHHASTGLRHETFAIYRHDTGVPLSQSGRGTPFAFSTLTKYCGSKKPRLSPAVKITPLAERKNSMPADMALATSI